jgi:high-affinity nickel-transport protein
VSSIVGVLLGLLVGLRHAFEPDHLTAMATLAAEARGPRRGALLGASWGVGHTLALVAVGAILLILGEALPARLGAAFELAVAGVLVLLGIRAIALAWRQGRVGPAHHHRHRDLAHDHGGPTAHVHLGRHTLAWRPLAVGLVHGLAGSGALTALAFAQLSSTASRLSYLGLFGVGSIAGMAIASAIASASLGRMNGRSYRALMLAAGLASIVLGVAWSLPLWDQLA